MLSSPNPTKLAVSLFLFLALACGPPGGRETAAPTATPAVDPVQITGTCADLTQPQDQLCSAMPHDASSLLNGYAGFSEQGQKPFDNFSWQSLVALNWPANPDGTPSNLPFNSDWSKPRVWDYFMQATQVFPPDGSAPPAKYPTAPIPPPECAVPAAELEGSRGFLTRTIVQLSKGGAIDDPDFFQEAAVNLPLIDQNLNYVVYELSVNEDEWQYITSNGLWQKSKQQGVAITLPPGSYADAKTQTGGPIGAIELKVGWRILDPSKGDDPSRYFTRMARIFVPASASATGKAFCTKTVTLGLVALHIVHAITSEVNSTWSTFEHVDNAPDTTTPVTDPGCAVPAVTRSYTFFNPKCQVNGQPCTANQPPTAQNGTYTWASSPPYAAAFALGGQFGTQVVRCTPVYSEADEMTAIWQKRLAGTPWANYRLVGTQWATTTDTFPASTVNIPTELANTIAETYVQKGSTLFTSNCLSCHAGAKAATGQPSDFSFLFGRAQ